MLNDRMVPPIEQPAPTRPPLAGSIRCDVAVVGGGLLGLSAALELATRGRDTVVLEADHVGSGASGRNGGQIVTAYAPGMARIEAWAGTDDARVLWDIAEIGKRLIVERVERHGIDCGLRRGLVYAGLKPRHAREAAELVAEWRRYGHTDARVLDRDGVRALVASERYTCGVWDGGGGQLEPLAYCRGLARATEASGARIFEGTRVQRLRTAGSGFHLETGGGIVDARTVVLAGNALLGRVEPRIAGLILPVTTGMIATAPLGRDLADRLIPAGVPVSDMNLVLDYFRIDHETRLQFGGGVSYSGIAPPRLAANLRRKMLRVFPALRDVPVERSWTGRIDISLNRMPQTGLLDGRIYYAQGFSGHGVALTQSIGLAIAEAVTGAPARFQTLARLPHHPFPGGPLLRRPSLIMGMAWARLWDAL